MYGPEISARHLVSKVCEVISLKFNLRTPPVFLQTEMKKRHMRFYMCKIGSYSLNVDSEI